MASAEVGALSASAGVVFGQKAMDLGDIDARRASQGHGSGGYPTILPGRRRPCRNRATTRGRTRGERGRSGGTTRRTHPQAPRATRWREDDMSEVPTRASAVVIGAGIVGNSLVHHLALLGWRLCGAGDFKLEFPGTRSIPSRNSARSAARLLRPRPPSARTRNARSCSIGIRP